MEAGLLPSDGQWACAASGARFGLEDGIGMEETEPRTGRAAPIDGAADPMWAGAEEEPREVSMELAVGQCD